MPRSLTALLRCFARNEDGVISVMAVGALVLALAVAMIVIDTGAMYSAHRYQQAATDAAALGAVRQISDANAARAAAETIFGLNDYSSENVTATPLYYVADPSLAPDARFFTEGQTASDGKVVDASNFNAIRVTKTSQSPTYFARLFGFGDSTQIETEAVAAYTKYVSFSAGTRLASLNEGLANQVLGGLLGTTVNLSLVDYNSLASANIDALEFLDTLATEVGLDAGTDTYGDLLGATVTIGDILNAAVEVLTGDTFDGDPSVAKLALQTALSPVSGKTVDVGDVLDLAPIAQRTVGSVGSSLGEGVPFNLLNLVSGTAMAVGEGQTVGINLATPDLSPLVSVSGTITVGEPMAHMAVGKVGDSVRTSQVTVQLNADVSAPLLGRILEVPIFIEAASGKATVKSIPCASAGDIAVLVGETNLGAAASGNPPTISYGTVNEDSPVIAKLSASLPILGQTDIISLKASGSVPLSSSGPVDVGFSRDDIEQDPQAVKTVSAGVSPLSALGANLHIEEVALLSSVPLLGSVGITQLASFLLTPLPDIVSDVTNSITNAMGPLDTVVNSLLTTLGVKLGSMDMIVHGAKCQSPTLVS